MKYLILTLLFYLAVSCDVKNQSSTADSPTAIENITETTTNKEMSIAETAAELKTDVDEKARMAKDKMEEAKDVMASTADEMADKPKEAMDKMKDKMSKESAIAKADMKDKNEMIEKELPMAKEEVTEAIASTTTAVATTKTSVTPVVNKETVEEKIEAMPVEEKKAMPVAGVDHSTLDRLLKKYVSSSGVVNYAGLNGVRSELNSYLDMVSKKIPDNTWSRNESLAYWINVYNAYTLDLILSNYPTSSITNLDGGKPWDVKRITLAGKKYSLNDIEHKIIRPQFNDARIHFAVNCAAKSCPKLNNGAMTEANVNSTLEKLTKQFVNNSSLNEISSGSASLSKIFEWYASDFGDLTAFINKYSTQKLGSGASISYVDYDWALNGK